MRKVLFVLLLLFAALAPAAAASDVRGSEVVIPVAGRWPGAFGSQWRTDLVITNTANHHNEPQPVFVVLTGNGGAGEVVTADVPPYGTLVMKDVIRTAFGHETGGGLLRVVTQTPNARITARARIYNTGSSTGEYGQTIQALPLSQLTKDVLLPGLSGVGVNRTNIGIANPGTATANVWISLFDSSGELRGAYSITVAPRSVHLINDVFSTFQAGALDSASVRIKTSHGVYAYASVVRSDTGDADMITGTALELDEGEAVVNPACANPAPLQLAVTPARGWIVIYQPGTDATATTAQLAARYGFTPISIFSAVSMFHAELTQAQIAMLRCEPAVKAIEQNAVVPID